jgi:hypothetical protein
MSDPQMRHIWRFLIETEQLSDGTWRAWSPTGVWSTTGLTEREAQDKAIDQAIDRGEDPDEVVRSAPRKPIEFEPDDPRVGWVWRFYPQTEQFSDGTWRAWFASGGWTVSGSTEEDAIEKANLEWFRRREEPDEVARRIALMRRHLIEPVRGVENFDDSVLASAWKSDNPAEAVRSIIEQLGKEQLPPTDS